MRFMIKQFASEEINIVFAERIWGYNNINWVDIYIWKNDTCIFGSMEIEINYTFDIIIFFNIITIIFDFTNDQLSPHYVK